MTKNVRDERSELHIPDFFKQMLERKWLGDKTKGGFYKKEKVGGRQEEETAGPRLENSGISSPAEAEVRRRSKRRRTSRKRERGCARCWA